MARSPKDWGEIPSPQQIADIMNSIEKLQDDVADTTVELKQVRAELSRREDLLDTARQELGRMLKARSERDLKGTEFRVIHQSEAHGDVLGQMFGIHSVPHDR